MKCFSLILLKKDIFLEWWHPKFKVCEQEGQEEQENFSPWPFSVIFPPGCWYLFIGVGKDSAFQGVTHRIGTGSFTTSSCVNANNLGEIQLMLSQNPLPQAAKHYCVLFCDSGVNLLVQKLSMMMEILQEKKSNKRKPGGEWRARGDGAGAGGHTWLHSGAGLLGELRTATANTAACRPSQGGGSLVGWSRRSGTKQGENSSTLCWWTGEHTRVNGCHC